ncbi:MAG: methyltransferase domain-containing protein [Alphaproteobacteria bacterium]
MTGPVVVFDRPTLRLRRNRAAERFSDHDFLYREVAERLLDRLDDITRKFPLALDLGCLGGSVAQCLKGRGGIETLVQCELAENMARRADRVAAKAGLRALTVVGDEEFLPFAEGSFDLVVSNLNLHWINDLPGVLIQARRALKPDGLFLATLLGAGSLAELRESLATAETALENGLSPRVSPFPDVRDGAHLLQRAGFAMPVADTDRIVVRYRDLSRLMADLRGVGATNAVALRRRNFSRRATLAAAMAAYQDRYADAEGRLPVTFEILTLTAWAAPEET